MALIKCKHCGCTISDKAKTCPHCGVSCETDTNQTAQSTTQVFITDETKPVPDEATRFKSPGMQSQLVNRPPHIPQIVNAKKKNTRQMILLFVISFVLSFSIVVGLFFLLHKDNDVKEDKIEEVEEIDEDTEVDEPIKDVIVNGKVFVEGTIAEYPFTLDLNVADNGAISGTYWNVLYDLKMPVSGTKLNNNDLSLTLGSGYDKSSLYLIAMGKNKYMGSMGKKNNPIVARLQKGSVRTKPVSGEYDVRMRISGNGINKVARIADGYFYYEDQGPGQGHGLKAEQIDDTTFAIYNDNGTEVGRLDTWNGSLVDHYKHSFKVTVMD